MFRDIVKSVAKNASIMYVQQLITWASTLLLMLFLPRYLGPVEYGKLFLALSVVGIFNVLVQYGGNTFVAKSVSRSKGDTAQILVDAIGFRLLFAVASFLGLVAVSFGFDFAPSVRTLIFILGINLIWQGGITVLYACFQGHEMMRYTSAGAIAERVFGSVVGVAALLLGANTVTYTIILLISGSLNFLVLAWYSKHIVSSFPPFNWQNAVNQIKSGFPYFLFAIFGTIYYRIGSVMLSKMAPEQVVGWYGGAFRLFDSLNFFPHIFTMAVFPVLARLWKEEEQIHRRATQKSLEFMTIIGVLVCVIVISFADKIIQLFYGLEEYSPSIIVLQILSAGLLILYMNMVLGTTLMSSDKQSQLSIASLAMIPINIALNYVLIPYFQSHTGNGGIGSAIATTITELIVMLIAFSLMPKHILKGFRVSVFPKSVAAGLLMGTSIVLVRFFDPLWVVAAFVGPVVYAIALFFMRTFEPSEEDLVRRILLVRSVQDFRNLIGSRDSGGK